MLIFKKNQFPKYYYSILLIIILHVLGSGYGATVVLWHNYIQPLDALKGSVYFLDWIENPGEWES